MKQFIPLSCFVTMLLFIACDQEINDFNDEQFADYLVAKPIVMSKKDFRDAVTITGPQPTERSGKIYAYKNIIFVNDQFKGVHVIDNSNPEAPEKKAFITIPGNVDISVKGDYLYADSVSDLVVLDISDQNAIVQVGRLENVFLEFFIWPETADIHDYTDFDHETEIQVGWELVVERRKVSEVTTDFQDELRFETAANVTGQGGSLARFKIVDDFLYAVDSHSINIFEISDLKNPMPHEDVFVGFDIETIFNKDQHLFLGSMRGMYIYDITDPATPHFVSEFQHGTACDPVVVDDQYAYVTLRGGNNCGAFESGLFIVDITSIAKPTLLTSYPMDEPYGLGIKGNLLFVCDGSSGLKVYDKTNPKDLQLRNHFENIITFDVIPMDEILLMVGDKMLYQYRYVNSEIQLISTLSL